MLMCNMYIALSGPVQTHNLICYILSNLPKRDRYDFIFLLSLFFPPHIWSAGPPCSFVRSTHPRFALQNQPVAVSSAWNFGMNQSKDGRGGNKMDSLDVRNLWHSLLFPSLADTHLQRGGFWSTSALPNITGWLGCCWTLPSWAGRL